MSEERPPIIVCKSLDEIHSVIRHELKLKNISHGELADRLGVSYASAGRLVNGRTALTVEQLYKVLSVLGIGVALTPPKSASVDPTATVPPRKKPVDLGVTLQKLFNAGKIKAGDILTSIPGEHNVIAEVGLRGDLILEDGSEFSSPSSAAKEIRGTTTNGWTFWGLDGRSLDDMRKELLAGK